jgi:hypothetical protein
MLSGHWQLKYGHPIYLAETFVDCERFISVISHKTYDHDMFPGPLSLCGVRPLPFHSILNRTGGLFRSPGFGASSF